MRRRRATGKHFDTWHIQVHGREKKSVEVRCRQKDDSKDYEFVAVYSPAKPDESRIECSNSDINKLRLEITKRLSQDFKIDWQKKLHVKMSATFEMADQHGAKTEKKDEAHTWSAQLEMVTDSVQIATDESGVPIQRYTENSSYQAGEPQVGPPKEDEGWKSYDMASLVEDTEENRQALQRFFDGFKLLKQKLEEAIHPKTIEKTLKLASPTCKLLPEK